MHVHLYAHISWVTYGRLPRIDERIAGFLERFLFAECRRHDAEVLALGMVRNHVHMVVQLPPRFDIPRLMQGLKGASARIANRDGIAGHTPLQWETGYDLRSIGPRQLSTAIAYVRSQAKRHPTLALTPARPCAEAPARPAGAS